MYRMGGVVHERYRNEKEYEKILYLIEKKRYKIEILSLVEIKKQLDSIHSEKPDG